MGLYGHDSSHTPISREQTVWLLLLRYKINSLFFFTHSHRTMKAGAGLFSALALFLFIGAVFTQRPRPRRPTKRPPTTRKPSVLRPYIPGEPEPQEPTDFPPVILGPPSFFPDCPRECSCSPSYPNALNCENRNIRVIPLIPFRTHYLYLQNNYISEVKADAFKNATDIRWINLANNRIHQIDKQVRKYHVILHIISKYDFIVSDIFTSHLVCRYLRRSLHCCISTCSETSSMKSLQASH